MPESRELYLIPAQKGQCSSTRESIWYHWISAWNPEIKHNTPTFWNCPRSSWWAGDLTFNHSWREISQMIYWKICFCTWLVRYTLPHFCIPEMFSFYVVLKEGWTLIAWILILHGAGWVYVNFGAKYPLCKESIELSWNYRCWQQPG